ncbi:UNVERIFIED_CONTAM: hypothetical protein RMT77_004715 [Armadillidium vulgare]
MTANRIRCFFDVEVDGVPLGRIIFELFNDVCPKTAENFRALCTGELGLGETTAKALHYRNVKFHRVIKDFMIQSGDFSSGNGTGGESIYGGQFEDENFDVKHDTPFLLSMANRGKDTNGSQFFITTQTASHLDGKHVVFGRVLSGQEVVVSIENLPVDNRSRPLQQAIISNCGELIMQTAGQVKAKDKKKKKKKVEETVETLDEKKKKKKKKEKKHKQKKEKDSSDSEEPTEDPVGDSDTKAVIDDSSINYKPHPLATISVINPEEIPEVPKNRFLDRGFQNRRPEGKGEEEEQSGRLKSKANVRFYTRSGRKVKGRGLLRYRTPSRSRSRSRSATPPHWRQAQRRTVTYERYQRHTEEMELREKEIEDRRKRREERHRMLGMGKDDQDEGEWNIQGKKLGSVIRGKMMSDLGPEDKTLKDWRIARHETLHEDKENVKDVMDLRQKLKGRSSSQSFAKGGSESRRGGQDEAPLDLDDLDYEAPSDLEDDENTDGQKENGTKERHSEERSMRNGKENREKKSSERDRERERRDGHRRVDDSRFRSRNLGDRDRERRYRDRERERRERDRRSRSRDRRSRSRDRRRDSRSREKRRRETSRDRNRSTRRHRERSRRRSSTESGDSKK